jgi:hypothetical protein
VQYNAGEIRLRREKKKINAGRNFPGIAINAFKNK